MHSQGVIVWKVAADGTLRRLAASFQRPVALALDTAGNLFVADSNAIWKIAADGTAAQVLQTSAYALAIDTSGVIYFR